MEQHAATVTDAELARLAELACLQLPDDVAARRHLADQLGSILGYVAAVQEYDVAAGDEGGDPISARADEPVANALGAAGGGGRPAWLDDAPRAEGTLVAVPALFAGRSNGNGGDA